MKCSVCKKNIAVVFVTKLVDGHQVREGMCLPCAQKQGIAPLDQLFQQSGMSNEDFENINEQMMSLFDDPEVGNEMNALLESQMNDPKEGKKNPFSQFFNNAFSGVQNASDDQEDMAELEEIDEVSGDGKTVKTKTKVNPLAKKRKNLEAFGTNLTDKAKNGEVDRIIGRHREIDRVIQILNRRQKNNPVLIGEPGVGKTAIAEGLAVRIVEKQVPAKLQHTEIYLLDLTAVVAGTQFRGQFESRMKAIINEAKEDGHIILVIDEVHNIAAAGDAETGAMNAANILKPALARGEVQIIGATTLDEYRKHIEKDAALERRFQPVIVEEPSVEDSIEIIKGIKDYYESYHKVHISDAIIEAAVVMSERYISDRFLPDKAIDVIDEAGSRANLLNMGLVELEALKIALLKTVEEKEAAAAMDNYEKAADCRVEELRITQKINHLEEQCEHVEIKLEDIAYVIEAWTKIPVQSISEDEANKLMHLEERLHRRVIGQTEAVTKVSKAIRRNRSGFKKRRKPASFIFIGPTGVGKTELTRTLAEEMFGNEEALIRLDMSEFMEKHTVSKLIGAPPGYVGYDQAGQLTEKVRRKPYSVLLLDEIEKAHPDVFNLLLQILEDGRLTDSQGRTVNFENTVIIMTSNAGTDTKGSALGFGNDARNDLSVKSHNALKALFRPEFLNRIDEIIVFTELSKDELLEIIDLMAKEIILNAREKDIRLSISPAVRAHILEVGYDSKYGARPLRRTLQRLVEDEISERYIQGTIKDGNVVVVDYINETMTFQVTEASC